MQNQITYDRNSWEIQIYNVRVFLFCLHIEMFLQLISVCLQFFSRYGIEERSHQCPSCRIYLKAPVHQVSHVCQQTFEKRAKDVTPGPKKCDICQNVYKSHKSLRKHKLAVHIEGVKPYQCKYLPT